jgi:hypothetical protein
MYRTMPPAWYGSVGDNRNKYEIKRITYLAITFIRQIMKTEEDYTNFEVFTKMLAKKYKNLGF